MNESIHARIKRLRLQKGLSMEALAKACGLKSWQAVQQWEIDDGTGTAPKRSRLKMAAVALGVSEQELSFGATGEAKKTTVPDDIRTMPRDQVADSVIAGMTEMFRLAGISLDPFIPAEELRQAVVEGRRPEVYSVRQILDAIGAARASVASGSFARLAINGTQLENVVMKALTGKEMAKPDEEKPHPDNTPNPPESVKNKGIRQ